MAVWTEYGRLGLRFTQSDLGKLSLKTEKETDTSTM
jgi:hypothetical protein